jgi:hypothetical protein
MVKLTIPRGKTTSKRFEGLLFDLLCCLLISVGVLLALRQLFRFENPFNLILLRSAAVLAITALVTRRWWYAAVFIASAFGAASLYLLAADGFAAFIDYVRGFIVWWVGLFSVNSEYNTAFNIAVVHWIITIWVCVPAFFLIRRIKSLYVVTLLAAVLFAVIIANGFRENFDAVCLIIAGSLPLLAKGNHIRLKQRSDKTLFTRERILAAGFAACVLCTLLANRAVPEDTSSWKNPKLSELLNRAIDSRHQLSRKPFNLITSGLQPNADRLGGDVELDHRLVMRVKTNQPALMKGKIYNIYTGRGWEDTVSPAYPYQGSPEEFEKAFNRNMPRDPNGENPLLDAMPVINTDATLLFGGYTFFYSGRLIQITAGKPASVSFNASSELFSQNRIPTRFGYSFKSTVINLSAENLPARIDRIERQASQQGGALYDYEYDRISEEYLQLPDGLPETVYRTAEKIAGKSSSNFEKILKLKEYLKTGFEYTLKPGDVPEGADFVEHFLKSGQGYCTYFASAMAVMSRAIGVPSRFVIGYGLVRDGKNYAAYLDNAHAWVECYFRGVGWVPFDPTAGSSYFYPVKVKPVRKPPSDDGDTGRDTTDGRAGQTTTTTTTSQGTSTNSDASQPQNQSGAGTVWIWLVAAVTAVLLAAAAALRALKKKKAYLLDEVRKRFPDTGSQINYYYADIIRQLCLIGLSPRTDETILQHGRRAKAELEKGDAGAAESAGERLLASFIVVMNLRYGDIQPGDREVEEIAKVREILENRLKNAINPVLYFFRRLIF